MSGGGRFRDWFEGYLGAFNRPDFPGFGAFYVDDVIFMGQAAQITGRDAILEFYRKVRSYLDEKVEVLSFVGAADERRIFAELKTTLVATRDWPEMPTGAMNRGEIRQSINFAIYDVVDRRFSRIRTANFARFGGARR